MFQPERGHYFPAHSQGPVALVPEICPFLYFSNPVMPFPVENPQMEEEWLKGDGDLDCWKNNCPSNVPRFSLNSHFEQRMQKMKRSSSVLNLGNLFLQCSQLEWYDRISPGFIDARYNPRAINTDRAKFCLQNPDNLDYMLCNIRPQKPPTVSSSGSGSGFLPASFAAPVIIRASTAASVGSLLPKSSSPPLRAPPQTRLAASGCSLKALPERMKNQGGIPPRHFMAPAVHIRSVVPVCSAPPTKKFPGPIGEVLLSGVEKKRPEEPRGSTSATS